jgi:hypothetical protein
LHVAAQVLITVYTKRSLYWVITSSDSDSCSCSVNVSLVLPEVPPVELINRNIVKEINAGFSGHHEKAVVMKTRKKDGTFVKTKAENVKVLFDHFHGVRNHKELSAYDPTALQEIDPCPTNTVLVVSPTLSEIKAYLQKMQHKKSLGKNGIPAEAFKNLKRGPLWAFKKFVELFWQKNQFNPLDWQHIKLSILPKKGDLANPNKW